MYKKKGVQTDRGVRRNAGRKAFQKIYSKILRKKKLKRGALL